MENVKEFKCMKKTEEPPEGYVYAPWIMKTTASSINNVKVWDHRWWVNVFCRINWFFHFRMRKRLNKYKNTKIDEKYYETIKTADICAYTHQTRDYEPRRTS